MDGYNPIGDDPRSALFIRSDLARILIAMADRRYTNAELMVTCMIALGYGEAFQSLFLRLKVVKIAATAIAGRLLFGKAKNMLTAAIQLLKDAAKLLGRPRYEGFSYFSDIIEGLVTILVQVLGLLGGIVVMVRAVLFLDLDWVDAIENELKIRVGEMQLNDEVENE